MAASNLVDFEEVSYLYPGAAVPAVQNLSLNIRQNQRYALIGRNGCGKTTFFHLINGLYKPQKGVIRWKENPLKYDRRSLNQLRQQIGLVFQNPEHQLVATTVEEDISYGLCNLGLPESEIASKVQQALLDFDLSDLADAPVNFLSLGQKKRISIADVMVLQPQLILLDEPGAYLDPHQVRNFQKILISIQKKGSTIVLSSHDLDFVEAWADWVFVMDEGRVVLEGSPGTVFSETEKLNELGLGLPLIYDLMNSRSDLDGNPANLNPFNEFRQRIRDRFWSGEKS
ncbi:MAG: ABC transporter ATP-binding protein [SAR324 cluster bacterium]|nr:ABC transporter ATP-binding protein [SAR324 cluster bacterium]